MTHAQVHRGPDGSGVFITADGRAGIANCRLAIQDVTAAGHMPMPNRTREVWITYNGEIYNSGELRPLLEQRGYVFRSTSDTELILHGFEAWGANVVDHLRGIFAIAILDLREGDSCGRLFLARDHLGVKPLYYAEVEAGFVFASELKAMRASGLISREISPAGLVGYLLTGSVPTPRTILRDVSALDSGSVLTVSLGEDVRGQPTRYWTMPSTPLEPPTSVSAVEQVRYLLEDAVKSQLVSDVPVGAFLSGGLDSSVVVALMRKATDGPIRTCSMIFEDTHYSEAPYAQAMAASVSAEHYESVITSEDVSRELERILWALEQPSVDGVNTYFVSRTAREAGLTVALSGLGGDELFGGYVSIFQGVPTTLRLLQAVHAVPGGSVTAQRVMSLSPLQPKWGRIGDALSRPPSPESAYSARRGLFAPSEVRRLVNPDLWQTASRDFDHVQYVATRVSTGAGGAEFARHPVGWLSRAELATYTHAQLLRDTDVMSMAHSLEVRVPFLDHRLVEAVLRLPSRLHDAGGERRAKPLLMSAAGHMLPAIVRARSRKQGFVFPFDTWLRGPLDGQVRSLLASVENQRWLQPSAVREVWDDYKAGRVHWSRLWALAVLQGGPLSGT